MKAVSRSCEASPGLVVDPLCRTTQDTGSRRILLVEDYELTAIGLKVALSDCGYTVKICTGPTPGDVVDCVRAFRPSCVLIDVQVGHCIGSGVALIRPMVLAGAEVVMLTGERRQSALAECLEAGAAGWISRSSSIDGIDMVLRRLLAGEQILGRTVRAVLIEELRLERARQERVRAIFERLSDREALVLAALTDGLTAEEIAREHYVALTTVRSQIRAVLTKLGVRTQLAAVAVAGEHRHLLPHRGLDQPDRRATPRRKSEAPVVFSSAG